MNYPDNKMVPWGRGRRITLIASLISLTSLFILAFPCPAKTTFTVQIAYGGVIFGGVELFLYFYHSLGSGLLSPDIMPALLNIRKGKIALGFPVIECEQSVVEISPNPLGGSYFVRVLRWEF